METNISVSYTHLDVYKRQAQARGVILVVGSRKQVPTYEYTPLQIKQAVVGYGRADKMQVQKMVKT